MFNKFFETPAVNSKFQISTRKDVAYDILRTECVLPRNYFLFAPVYIHSGTFYIIEISKEFLLYKKLSVAYMVYYAFYSLVIPEMPSCVLSPSKRQVGNRI